MTPNQHGPYVLGRTRDTMVGTKSLLTRKRELISSKPTPVRIEVCNSTS